MSLELGGMFRFSTKAGTLDQLRGRLKFGAVVGLMAVREIWITVMRMVAARREVVLAADTAGKRKTIWQVTGICVLFAVPMVEEDWSRWLGVDLAMFGNYVYLNGLLYFGLAAWLTLASGAHYVKAYGPLVFGNGRDAGRV